MDLVVLGSDCEDGLVDGGDRRIPCRAKLYH